MYQCSMMTISKIVKKIMVTSIKNICIKLKGEVGMAMPKSTQTRVVGIITYMVHPYACFSHYGAMSCIHACVTCKASYFSFPSA